MIKRNLEVLLVHKLKKSPAVAILGPRQVGKTTLAKHLNTDEQRSVYLDMENPIDQNKLQDAFSYLTSHENDRVIIDEIQLMPALFSILRPLIDAKRTPGRFILLGSASPSLVKGVSETLAGRIAYTELTPIGITEVSSVLDYRMNWFRGGFPEAFLAENNGYAIEWLNDFIRSYVERDLALLFGVALSPVLLRNFWSMLAHSNGNLLNTEVFARSLGVSATTVTRYLDFLEGGYMVRRLQPWFVNAKKRLIKSPKTYIRDTGILHRLLNIANQEDLFGHPGVGGSWEGYVVEQIFQAKPDHLDLFFYRTQAGAECDLLLVEGVRPRACIEIKLSNAPVVSKGFLNCIADLEPESSFIITPQSETYISTQDVVIISISSFIETRLNSF
ncbi:ATP-binding protein [Mucilaginibacter sabulilitoris]|uniref:ATP-binding protein n=1 Tax=Mucilaginibacter sabulilitoris TaxID=1173583 RepID=A0ABZ0TJU7_9SPHI|nr:ATP-binding protein [Mucilaginibacter sabulilitoris]WPU92468.1 ATP-binding protein [Mucilaginibacter sabulilitoris]